MRAKVPANVFCDRLFVTDRRMTWREARRIALDEGKLIRDNIPDIMRSRGKSPSVVVLDDVAYGAALREKLHEELSEYVASRSVEELADILEVVYALGEAEGVAPDTLEQMRAEKRARNGGFTKRLFLRGEPGRSGSKEAVADTAEQPSLTIQELQRQVQALKEMQGWVDQTLERRAVFLISEVGEMAKELLALKWTDPDELARARQQLGMEMYDVVWNLFDLANLAGVDLEAAFAAKAEHNERRRW